ncbi:MULTISPECIES: hypothetical protein [Streptomyces]|uniref:AG2 protein n=1 Tax=Streptomyces xinghaiensis TaxID=1038928 RepID=A0A420V7K6_9ACTN|nr:MULTISPECIES: hypothetical protein [Streptomyces]OFA56512.1 hypothetical protein BEN35_06075 [Streptomyces fradiae]PQM22768.1 hypothetical protein Sfr7A_13750 [Streptomyces xinghaiensis]RKM97937.1 hypothetical protein SFRA_005185 [Streptomyces xinghaiensis]RNC73926.1 hypothetical protein DC095_013795 [Streptomyces xinghaiensis]
MMTPQQLSDLHLGKLGTAASEWKVMVGKLEKLAGGGDGGISAADLRRKAEAADWQGDNATVTRKFVGATARQFDDILTEARSVQKILLDAHTRLKKHKTDMSEAITRWAKQNIYINDKGGAVPAVPPPAVAGEAKVEPPTQAELDSAAAEIGRILNAASEVDRIAARALRQHARSAYDFDETGYKGLTDADRRQGIADADTLLKLAAKRDGMTLDELKFFNETAARQRDNPAFAERFVTKLGPEGTLQFWRSLADPGRGDTPTGERAKVLARVQDNLSLTLATASHGDSPAMREWKSGVIAAGENRMGHPGLMSAPYGFQVMSSLMGKGKFDSGFLDAYGNKLVEFERSQKVDPEWLWDNAAYAAQLSYPPDAKNPSVDPVAGFLESLGHNPQASLEFFNGSSGGGPGQGSPDRLSNWDYLVGGGEDAREWPMNEDGEPAGYEKLGHALESATLGYAYDDRSPAAPPLRTDADLEARDARTALMDRVVGHYKGPEVIESQPGVGESLARMAGGHIDSLNYSVDNWGGSGELNGRDELFGAEKNHLRDFGMTESAGFLRALAAEKDSYDTVSAAQQVYGASAMAAQGDDREQATNAGLHSVKMHGLLDESRAEAIGKEFADDEAAKNKALEKQAEWRKLGASTAIATTLGIGAAVIAPPVGAAALVAVPLAFGTAQGIGDTQFATDTIDWLEEREYSNDAQALGRIRNTEEEGRNAALIPLLGYAEARGVDAASVRDLVTKAQGVYNDGKELSDTEDLGGDG